MRSRSGLFDFYAPRLDVPPVHQVWASNSTCKIKKHGIQSSSWIRLWKEVVAATVEHDNLVQEYLRLDKECESGFLRTFFVSLLYPRRMEYCWKSLIRGTLFDSLEVIVMLLFA